MDGSSLHPRSTAVHGLQPLSTLRLNPLREKAFRGSSHACRKMPVCYAPAHSGNGPRRSALIHRFGVFELDTAAGTLCRKGRQLPLQEQPLQVLAMLVERPSEVVSRQALRRRLWPADVHVDFDNGINAAVARLREVLGDTAANPRFVATVPRRGYRFIAPVEAVGAPAAPEATSPSPSPPSPSPLSPSPPSPSQPWWRRALGGGWKLGALVVAAALTGALVTGLLASRRPAPPSPFAAPMRLAVLPFINLGTDPDKSFLDVALTEELIALLGRLQPQRLRVIARTSVMGYQGSEASIEEIGRRLEVGYVLEGTVQQEGDLVRVTTALVEVAGETRRWSAAFDRRLGSLLTLEREIAAEVAKALALELLADAPPPAMRGRAHEHYLEGRYFLFQLTEEGFRKAVRAFEAAIAEDPRAAAAHAGLAQAWAYLGLFDFVPIAEAHPQARARAAEALALDPASAEAHLASALVHHFYGWDFAAAEAAYGRAVVLNPSYADAHFLAAQLYLCRRQFAAAVAAGQRALALDPLSRALNSGLCWLDFAAGEEELGMARCQRALELDPDFLDAWDNLKWIHIRRGDEEAAEQAFIRVVALEKLHLDALGDLHEIAAREGIAGLLRVSVAHPEERLQETGQSPYNLVLDFASLGEVDQALHWLERAYAQRETDLVYLAVDPRLDPLRQEARFQALLERVGLADLP